MGGLKLRWDEDSQDCDLTLVGRHLEREEGLETYVLISNFTDARAPDAAALPTLSDDRRGWWADEFHEVDGQFGSLLWLLATAKRTNATIVLLQQYARQSIEWMRAARMASGFEVTAEFVESGAILRERIFRPNGKHPFEAEWEVQSGI